MKPLVAIVLLVLTGCGASSHHFTIDEVEQAIRSGKVDKKIAEHVSVLHSLSVREVSASGLPIQLFAFEDDTFTHTLLVDGAELVLLCGGPKGSIPHNLHLERDDSRWVLTFKLGVHNASEEVPAPGRYVFRNPPKL